MPLFCFTNCLLFYFLASEWPPLGVCRRGRRYFCILSDACGLRTHFLKKVLCRTCPVVGWRTNKVLQKPETFWIDISLTFLVSTDEIFIIIIDVVTTVSITI